MERKGARRRVQTYQTTVEDVVIRGDINHVITKCEALGYEARRDKDEIRAQRFFQTADHYKRIKNNDTE